MIIISHRGNLDGPLEGNENTVPYIEKALHDFDVEIDVWHHKKKLWLGHDFPQDPIEVKWLLQNKKKLWIHCKNLDAMDYLCELNFTHPMGFNFFGHSSDDFVLTSQNYIFTLPFAGLTSRSVLVMPEFFDYDGSTAKAAAVLTDFPKRYIS
jgi:hypothetical protein